MRLFRTNNRKPQPRIVVLLDYDGVVLSKQDVFDVFSILKQCCALAKELQQGLHSNDLAGWIARAEAVLKVKINGQDCHVKQGHIRGPFYQLIQKLKQAQQSNKKNASHAAEAAKQFLDQFGSYVDSTGSLSSLLDKMRFNSFTSLLLTIRDYQKGKYSHPLEFMIGTNRQTVNIDYYNSAKGYAQGASCTPFFGGQVASQFKVHTLTQVDVYSSFVPGTNYAVMDAARQRGTNNEAELQKYASQHLGKHTFVFDSSKISWLYAAMHYQALQNPDQRCEFVFVDDTDDICEAVHKFFKQRPQLIPRNVQLNIQHTKLEPSGVEHEVRKNRLIKGSGDVDPHFDMWCLAFAKLNCEDEVLERSLHDCNFPRVMRDAARSSPAIKRDNISCPEPHDVRAFVAMKQRYNYHQAIGNVLSQLNQLTPPTNVTSAWQSALGLCQAHVDRVKSCDNTALAEYHRYLIDLPLRHALINLCHEIKPHQSDFPELMRLLDSIVKQLAKTVDPKATPATSVGATIGQQGTLDTKIVAKPTSVESTSSALARAPSSKVAMGSHRLFPAKEVLVISAATINEKPVQDYLKEIARRADSRGPATITLQQGVQDGVHIQATMELTVSRDSCTITCNNKTLATFELSATPAPK